jgi:hypothetical protein
MPVETRWEGAGLVLSIGDGLSRLGVGLGELLQRLGLLAVALDRAFTHPVLRGDGGGGVDGTLCNFCIKSVCPSSLPFVLLYRRPRR